ncbi:MAG: site-specific integrase [Lachnospiraceae bacterium]|nr:site-specific integrase [Lachnospiraceae bacterium]
MNNVTAMINSMNIKMRADNRFEGRITVNGKRKSFYGATKAEIKQKAKEYLQKVENGYKDPKRIKFNEYAEYWLVTYKFGKIEPSSYTRLYRVFDSQIRNTIGEKFIGEIKTEDIQRLIDEYANPSNDTIKPLAISGLKKILQFLRPCFKMAVKEEIISSNPCDDIILPNASYVVVETKCQNSLNDIEIEQFRNAALEKCKTTNEYRSRNAIVLLIILNLGLRAGEALALEWDDINLNDKIVYINKTLQCGIKNSNSEGSAYISRIKKSAKTKSGTRYLQLNNQVIFYLNELMEYDKRNNIKSKYVCCNNYGKINNHRNLQYCLDSISKKIGLSRHITLHTLRHTFGSTLIRRGVGIEVISKLMGHANITITFNKYIHTIKEEEAKAMNIITIC